MEQEDPEIIAKIEGAKSADELMDVVKNYNFLVGRENDAFLRRALELNLCNKRDWADVCDIAEEGSELEKVAEEKAGDALNS